MNSVSLTWIATARKASHALVALLLVAAACDSGGGTASDTDDPTTDGTAATTNNTDQPTGTTDDTGTPTTTDSAGEVSYTMDVQPIWDANCTTGCHIAGGTASTWFLLTAADSYNAIVEKMAVSNNSLILITPGDRDASYIWHKINGTHFDAGGSGTAMPPPPAAMLSSADLNTIGTWIDQGANP